MRLEMELEYGRGGTGNMFQIASAIDVDSGKIIEFTPAELGMHFADRNELQTFLNGKFREKVEIVEGEQ